MSGVAWLLALGLSAPSLRVSVDRSYLPGESGESEPTVHVAAHGSREVEVRLVELRHPLRTFLGAEEREAAGAEPAASVGGELRRGWADILSSLTPAAREVASQVAALGWPLGLGLAATGTAAGPPPEGRLIRAWRLPTSDSGWNYQDLGLGALGPGLYEVRATAGDGSARVLLSVSRLALLAEVTAEGTSVLATDAADGHALAGVELFSLPSNTGGFPTALGKTGPAGLWSSRSALEGPIAGRYEGQLARVVLPEVGRAEAPGRAAGAGAVFLDRASHAPGDGVRVWSLLRTREGGSWKIPEAEEAELELVDAAGTVLLEQAAEISALGIVSAELPLPWGLPAGWYAVAVRWGGNRSATGLRVVPGAPAELSARWEAPGWSEPARPLVAAVAVQDRLGRPAPGAAVHWRAEARGLPAGGRSKADEGPSELLGQGAGVSGGDGRLEVRIPPGGGDGRVVLRATVEDAAGRTAVADAEVPRVRAPVLLELLPSPRLLRPGHTGLLSIEAQPLETPTFRGPVKLAVVSVHSSPGGEAVRTHLIEREVALDARGRAQVTLPAAPSGYLEIEASLPGAAAPLATASAFVTESGGDIPTTPDRLELVLDKREYARGDELRALVLTPFEQGTVLIGVEPGGEPRAASVDPPVQLLTVHGYSAEAHLVLPLAGSGVRVVAAALVGGTLYRASAPVPLAERAPALALRLLPDPGPRPGTRIGVDVVATDAEGHRVPAAIAVWTSAAPVPAPPLGKLFSLDPPAAAWFAGSSGAADSAREAPWDSAPRRLQPYGPSDLDDDRPQPPEGGQLSELTADDSGLAALALRVPAEARRLAVTVRAVGGPTLFGERSAELSVPSEPRVSLDAPAWVRAGDRFEVGARIEGGAAGADGCGVALSAAGGRLGESRCSSAGRDAEISSGAEGDATEAGSAGEARGGPEIRQSPWAEVPGRIDVSASLPASKLPSHRAVEVLQPLSRPALSTAGELAAELASGLSGAEAGQWPDVDCAAVRAGALLERPRAAAAVARLLSRQNLSGGFGEPEGELRRDLAAARGLLALQAGGAFVDGTALSRLRERTLALAQGEAAPEERGRIERLLGEPPRPRHGARRPTGDPDDIEEAPPSALADWLEGHRPTAAGSQAILERLGSLLPDADPLDAAEIAAALAALPPGAPVAVGPHRPAVARSFRVIERKPWTPELLAADEEPAEPALRSPSLAIPLDAEVEVALSADVPGAPRLACLRDFPPAGLAPVGRSDHLPRGLLLCGQTLHGRLDVSYLARAVRAGRYVAPGPVADLAGGPGPAAWVEVSP
ncbi:MAG: hypothetical protein ACYDCL_17345 [Myxococcales bacterium]